MRDDGPLNYLDVPVYIAAHLQALIQSPRAYLTAAKWRLLGKRLRSRGQMAPLLGKTRFSYALWLIRERRRAPAHVAADELPPIVALVMAGDNPQDIQTTMQSLSAAHVAAHIIKSEDPAELVQATQAMDWTCNPWFMVVDAGDQVAPDLVSAYHSAIVGTSSNLAYADDDMISVTGKRSEPYFKPDWNGELLIHHDYLSEACICRLNREQVMALSRTPDWPIHMVRQSMVEGGAIHVQRILHHRKSRPQPLAIVPPLPISAAPPLVSIIIPTRNRVDLLRTCLDGVRRTDYPHVEIIIVDNDSDDPETLAYLAEQEAQGVRVLRYAGAFNYSAINNYAVAHATGQLLCLLNNDIEVLAPDWLAIMATQAMRDDVGAVGAQLLYPDGRIQHAGVVIGVGNAAGHAHRFLRPEDEGYFRRHALPQFVSAVTAACFVVARERFVAVGGLDEVNFKVAFNDVDLCLRLNQRGWQSFYEPRAVLIHHESVSRGFDRDPVGAARFAGELAALQRIWQTDVAYDPYHHPELSRASEQFALAL